MDCVAGRVEWIWAALVVCLSRGEALHTFRLFQPRMGINHHVVNTQRASSSSLGRPRRQASCLDDNIPGAQFMPWFFGPKKSGVRQSKAHARSSLADFDRSPSKTGALCKQACHAVQLNSYSHARVHVGNVEIVFFCYILLHMRVGSHAVPFIHIC